MSWNIGAAQNGGWNIGVDQDTAHVFDLSTQIPSDFCSAYFVGWYGDDADAAADRTYGNWDLNGKAWNASDPTNYPAVPYVTQDASLCADYLGLGRYRQVGSHFRPITGHRSGADTGYLGLVLGLTRRAGDPRARITTINQAVICLIGTGATGAIPGDADYRGAGDLRWRSFTALLAAASGASIGCVSPTYNVLPIWAGWYDAELPTDADKRAQMQTDLTRLVTDTLAAAGAGYYVNGRLLVTIYTGSSVGVSTAEWTTILETVRAATGHDFYVLSNDKTDGTPFVWADALTPWTGYYEWTQSTGATDRLKALDWATRRTDDILAAVGGYPGRVVIDTLSPGKHDWAMDWGNGTVREIPRSEDIMLGQIDHATANPLVKGFLIATFEDFPEGTILEPNVSEGTTVLEWTTEALAGYYAEVVDPLQTAALAALWTDYVGYTCPVAAPVEPVALGTQAQAGAVSGVTPSGAVGVAAAQGANA